MIKLLLKCEGVMVAGFREKRVLLPGIVKTQNVKKSKSFKVTIESTLLQFSRHHITIGIMVIFFPLNFLKLSPFLPCLRHSCQAGMISLCRDATAQKTQDNDTVLNQG